MALVTNREFDAQVPARAAAAAAQREEERQLQEL